KKISWKDLKEEELIVYHPSSAIQKLLQKPLQKVLRNHSINIGMELRSVESVIKSVEAGLGIGFISEYSLNNKLKVIPIDNFSVERKFFISHKKNSGKSLRLLINEFLLEANNKN
ncbi:MAG: LysR family transcriptional regulator, partial [Leptospiraceae bacterium]|nr:LysR family transcriptional regulator [Leptospiraceae bacterium]